MLALGLLVCMLFARPVLAAMGEVHELAHDPSGQHSHIEEGIGSAGDPADEGSPEHALLHFAHCCAQLSTVLASATLIPAALPEPVPALGFEGAPAEAGVRVSPFRPPIRG